MNRKFNTHGGYFAPRGYSKVEAGGKHHENPNGGVQYGVDAQGVPNMLEEGEPVYDDFVYSDNIEADADFLAKYNLPTKFAGKLYSEIADAFVDEAAERPLDPTSNNGLNKMLTRLADAQEAQKQSQQQNDLQTELDGLSPEEMQQLQTMLAGSGQEQGQPTGMEDLAMMQQQMMAQQQMMPQEAAMAPEGVMARGGCIRRFDEGGNAFDEGQGLSLARPQTLWLMPSDSNGNLYDTIQPAVVTAPLPNGMTQQEARNRMEGYLFGQQVARRRDQWGKDALALADQATGGLITPLSLASSMADGDALGMGLNMAAALLPFTAVLPADEAAKAAANARKLSAAKGQATRRMNKLAEEIQAAEKAGDVVELARLKKLQAEQETLWKKAADELDELNKVRQPKPETPAAPATQTTPSTSSPSPAPEAATPAHKKKELWVSNDDPRYAAYKNEITWTKGVDKNKARNANILWNPVYNTRKLWQSELPFTQKAVLTGRDLLWTPNIPANIIRTTHPIGSAVDFFQTEKPHGYINDADTTEFTEPVLYHTGEVKRPNSYDDGGPVLVNDWTEIPDDFFRWLNWQEGFRSQSYGDKTGKVYNVGDTIDPSDTLTVGYSRTINVKPGDTTTREEERAWLLNDLNERRRKVAEALSASGITSMTPTQFAALVDLSYNGGVGLVKSILRKSKGDPTKIRSLLSDYATTNAQTGEKEPRLVNRAKDRVRMWDGNLNSHEGIYQYQLTHPELKADGYFGAKTLAALRADGYSDQDIAHFRLTGELSKRPLLQTTERSDMRTYVPVHEAVPEHYILPDFGGEPFAFPAPVPGEDETVLQESAPEAYPSFLLSRKPKYVPFTDHIAGTESAPNTASALPSAKTPLSFKERFGFAMPVVSAPQSGTTVNYSSTSTDLSSPPVVSSGQQVVPSGAEASDENEHPVSIGADDSGQIVAQQPSVGGETTVTEDTALSSQQPATGQSGGVQYSTWPMYAGAINAGLSGLYNAFQKPDRYDYGTYVPNIPSAQAPHFVNPTFTPDDENRYVNDLLSQGASMVRAMQSAPGGSSRAALIAANNAIMKNLADARAKVRNNNIAQRNTVTQSRNTNASALANFNMTNAQNRSNIMNAAQQYNLERLAQQQAANYAAEGQKYAALQSNINAMADALAGIGRQNATLNRINNDPTFDYSTFLNGTTIKKGQ